MSYLPERREATSLTPRQAASAGRAQRRTELAIFNHALDARYLAEVDRLDGQATADALQASLDEEISLLDYGMSRAGGSNAKAQLVAEKVAALAAINNRRINRRFGS